MKVGVVKYNAGNVASVLGALERLGAEALITDSGSELLQCDRVIFPGVGEARTAMNYLCAYNLDKVLTKLTQPFLGICLGLQLMTEYSEEGDTRGLGIFQTRVCRFAGPEKVPHTGWNEIASLEGSLFRGISGGSCVYFVHSYRAELCAATSAVTTYGDEFSAALHYNNFYGVQFHPEKSGEVGERILGNFLSIKTTEHS